MADERRGKVGPTENRPRRSLILAGGGLKVAAQAGVLQVWLDEAGIDFDHADGASGGVLNLAMWCQGMTGIQIADNWRAYRPLTALTPNVTSLLLGPFGGSLLTLRGYRERVFKRWGLNWHMIRSTRRDASFNLYDFGNHELVVRPPAEMTADLLLAAVSLPVWFPPVRHGLTNYIDAVFATDANLEEAIQRGADELWIIWTVSRSGRWRRGWINGYFQMIEACANSRFKEALARIERNNDLRAHGEQGEFGRHIEVRCLHIEVPLHYLVNTRASAFPAAVEQGVRAARAWCSANGVPLDRVTRPDLTAVERTHAEIRFSERMSGPVVFGAANLEEAAAAPPRQVERLTLRLRVAVTDLAAFLREPRHAARLAGYVESESLGGPRPIRSGRLTLLYDVLGGRRRMRYHIWIEDMTGRPLTVVGVKDIHDNPGADLWADTTSLITWVHQGHLPDRDDAEGPPKAGPPDEAGKETEEPADMRVAAGMLRLTGWGLVRMLLSFRSDAPSVPRRLTAFARFAAFFLGTLGRQYAPRAERADGERASVAARGGHAAHDRRADRTSARPLPVEDPR